MANSVKKNDILGVRYLVKVDIDVRRIFDKQSLNRW